MRTIMWRVVCALTLLAAATQAHAQAGSALVMRTRGTGATMRASAALNSCQQSSFELRALESAQRVQPAGGSTERREVFLFYSVADRCTRTSIGFQIEASGSAQLSVRRQLDRGELNLDAASITARRCQARGTAFVCQLVQIPVKLHVTWSYNGLYELHVGTSSNRDSQGFQIEAVNDVRHLANASYRFELDGTAISFDRVDAALVSSTEAQISLTRPSEVPLTVLP